MQEQGEHERTSPLLVGKKENVCDFLGIALEQHIPVVTLVTDKLLGLIAGESASPLLSPSCHHVTTGLVAVPTLFPRSH